MVRFNRPTPPDAAPPRYDPFDKLAAGDADFPRTAWLDTRSRESISTRRKLDRLISEQRRTNMLLRLIAFVVITAVLFA